MSLAQQAGRVQSTAERQSRACIQSSPLASRAAQSALGVAPVGPDPEPVIAAPPRKIGRHDLVRKARQNASRASHGAIPALDRLCLGPPCPQLDLASGYAGLVQGGLQGRTWLVIGGGLCNRRAEMDRMKCGDGLGGCFGRPQGDRRRRLR